MKKTLSNFICLSIILGAPLAYGYGGGGSSSRSGGGGGVGISAQNACPDFQDITPKKNESLGILDEVSFIAPSGYVSDSVLIEIDGDSIQADIKEKENGDLVVVAPLSGAIASREGLVKISFQASNQKTRCEKNVVYFVTVDPGIVASQQGDKQKNLGNFDDSGLRSAAPEEEEKSQSIVEFKDTKIHWAKNYISKLVDKKIMSSFDDGSFKPDDSVGRAEIVKIALSANNYDISGEKTVPFEDVSADSWAAPYLQKAKDLGIVYGYWGNKTFEPFAEGTRAMALKLLAESGGVNIAEYQGRTSFSDVSATAWYAPYVAWANENGIVNGYSDGSFGPNNRVTRGEMAKITSSFLAYSGR